MKWFLGGLGVYLFIAFMLAAYNRAVDISSNKNTYTKDYFEGLLWPLYVVYIPYGMVEGTALLISKYLVYKDRKARLKKFGSAA